MVLSRIIAAKRDAVLLREQERPLSSFIKPLKLSDRNFFSALSQDAIGFIFECKKGSPSEKLLRTNFDIAEIVSQYQGIASAISVVTDEPFFAGKLESITEARRLAGCPILCKDFIISPYQVYEARYYGADAILLMLSVLEDDTYRACHEVADALCMGVLTEVHNEKEMHRALNLKAKIIGINNRDLRSLQIDLATTEKLASMVPKGQIVISESGIKSRQDIERLAPYVDGFLVGSHLMRQSRIDLGCRELAYGTVKICGLTRNVDAHMSYAAGATYGGLIFYSKSPRYVTLNQAKEVKSQVPLKWVGVFVNETIENVSCVASQLELAAVQLHGDETKEYVIKLRNELPKSCEIWKAIRVRGELPLCEEFGVNKLVLDAYVEGQLGGTGKVFDWTKLANYSEKHRIILSGGIGPDNIQDARRVGVLGFDVNSKVESSPGVKKQKAIQDLFSSLRGKKI